MPGQPNPDDLAYTSYGLGWMVASYRGHYRLEHGGGIDGFITSVVLLPHDGLGVAVMANHGGTPLPDVVARHATDLLLELEPIDWHGQRKQAAAAAGGDTEDVPLPGTRFAHPLADYRGEYEHPGYGVITIRAEDDALTLSYNTFSTPLEHFHYETFRAAGPDLEDTKVTFHTNAGGEVAWLATGLEAAVDDIEFAHKPVVREHVVKRAPGPIEVDGRLDDAAWKKAAWTEDFVVHDTGAPTDRRTRARMLWTDTHWYLAWSIDDPGLAAELTEHDSNVWQEDSVELFIDPDGDERNYLQVVVSALGTVMDHSVSRASRAGVISDTDWTLEGLQVGVQVDGSVGDHGDKDKRWTCELAVPFAAIESASPAMSFPPVDGDAWRVNLYRTDRDLRDDDDTTLHTAWSRTDRRGYHAPDRFGRVVFSAEVAD
jgi:hypothetical protein